MRSPSRKRSSTGREGLPAAPKTIRGFVSRLTFDLSGHRQYFAPPLTQTSPNLSHMNGPLYVYNIYTDFNKRLGKRNILILCDFVNPCLGVLT